VVTPVGSRPSEVELAAARLLLEPWQWLTAPRITGLEHLPGDRPILVVANHTLMGVLDVPLLVFGLYEQRGIFLRSLGDHLHFRIPLWRDLLTHFGTVDGTRENCRALMRAGESILVFPGGGREVFKHKHEKYRLIWKERVGFVRLAVEHGYAIVPLAAVGAEECYDILVDSDELLATPLGPLLRRLAPRPDEIPPLVRGIGPLPRPERFYFHFGRPIDTRPYAGRQRDAALCMALRERVRGGVERGLRRLLAERARDPQRALRARLFTRLRRALAAPPRARASR
jgi:1-acyl-sn-glycerol-3-phosphate acyltransferase